MNRITDQRFQGIVPTILLVGLLTTSSIGFCQLENQEVINALNHIKQFNTKNSQLSRLVTQVCVPLNSKPKSIIEQHHLQEGKGESIFEPRSAVSGKRYRAGSYFTSDNSLTNEGVMEIILDEKEALVGSTVQINYSKNRLKPPEVDSRVSSFVAQYGQPIRIYNDRFSTLIRYHFNHHNQPFVVIVRFINYSTFSRPLGFGIELGCVIRTKWYLQSINQLKNHGVDNKEYWNMLEQTENIN